MSLRSTTGCYTCKRRKKKCDETHPECQRCTRSGLECSGYAPLNNPDSKGVMRRAKVPPLPESSDVSANWLQNASPRPTGSFRSRKVGFNKSPPTEEAPFSATGSRSRNSQAYIHINATPNVELDSGLMLSHLGGYSNLPSPPDFNHDPTSQPIPLAQFPNGGIYQVSISPIPPIDQQVETPSSGSSSGQSISTGPSKAFSRPPSDMSRRHSSNIRPTNPPLFVNSGKASLFRARFSLTEPETGLPVSDLSVGLVSQIAYGPTWPPNLSANTRDDQSAIVDEADPEDIKRIMCKDITPDPNTPSNALPFVLQCYARWVNFTAIDPLRVVYLMRDDVIAQFSRSQGSRTRVILISNVIGTLGVTPELSAKGLSLVALLMTEAHQAIEHFHKIKPAGQQDVGRQEASKTLDHVNEVKVILIQRFASPLSTVFKLMEAAAPVFRRACLESPRELVNLPRVLLESGLNLRNFAVTDVLTSLVTARPMLFKYDVTYTPEMDDQMATGDFGMQWLHGIPDQFVVSFAWINRLYEDFGTAVDPQCVADIEEQVRSVGFIPAAGPAAPFLAVWRLAAQECWRQIVYMHLYMVLCGAQTDDPRVLKAVRAFTRLMDGIKPGRNPDSFLLIPIMVAGAYAYETRDRDILRRRMLGLRECTSPGTAGHECFSILLDIWERTEAEKRPAVWRDLRIASLKVAGV